MPEIRLEDAPNAAKALRDLTDFGSKVCDDACVWCRHGLPGGECALITWDEDGNGVSEDCVFEWRGVAPDRSGQTASRAGEASE